MFNTPSQLLVKSTQQFLNEDLLHFGNKPLVVDGIIGKKSIAVIEAYTEHIYQIQKTIPNSRWDAINIIGFRKGNQFTDKFSDYLLYVGNNNFCAIPASTKAGRYYVHNPITYGGVTGTAVVKEGYYKDVWVFKSAADWKSLWLGMPYMQQIGYFDIYRDRNKNDLFDDTAIIQHANDTGINMHHAGIENIIYNWSAGCQIAPKDYYSEMLQSIPFVNGKLYSYWLINV